MGSAAYLLGSALLDPPLNVALTPDAALSEVGGGLGEARGAGELVGSLPADGKHLPDLSGSDEFHSAEEYRLTASSASRTLPLDTVKGGTMTKLTRKEMAEAVLAELRGVGPRTVAEIQSDLRVPKRAIEDALWLLCSHGRAEYDYPMTAPPTYKARSEDRPNENADRCPVCGGLNPGDTTHTRCM